jgi:hypothetical protein
MLSCEILRGDRIVILKPEGPLSKDDFRQVTADVDRFLEQYQTLKGLLIHAKEFPGWENLAGFISHVRFIRDHHRQIARVALASDSTLAAIAPKLVEHFVNAEIKGFDYVEKEHALEWLRQES